MQNHFFLELMEAKIAIQGIKGSFHHQIAQKYFGVEIHVEECLSFDELVDSLLSEKKRINCYGN
jgi:prephenate dehydratase